MSEIALAAPELPELKVASSVPSELRRTIFNLLTPPTLEKEPPITTFPSDCKAIEFTLP